MRQLTLLLGTLSLFLASCGDDPSQAEIDQQTIASIEALNYCSTAADCSTVGLGCTPYPINVNETENANTIVTAYNDTYGGQEIACPAVCQLGHLECKSEKCAIVSGSNGTDPPTCF